MHWHRCLGVLHLFGKRVSHELFVLLTEVSLHAPIRIRGGSLKNKPASSRSALNVVSSWRAEKRNVDYLTIICLKGNILLTIYPHSGWKGYRSLEEHECKDERARECKVLHGVECSDTIVELPASKADLLVSQTHSTGP